MNRAVVLSSVIELLLKQYPQFSLLYNIRNHILSSGLGSNLSLSMVLLSKADDSVSKSRFEPSPTIAGHRRRESEF